MTFIGVLLSVSIANEPDDYLCVYNHSCFMLCGPPTSLSVYSLVLYLLTYWSRERFFSESNLLQAGYRLYIYIANIFSWLVIFLTTFFTESIVNHKLSGLET